MRNEKNESENNLHILVQVPIRPKFDSIRVRTHDPLIMTSAFHVTETIALTTRPSLTSAREQYQGTEMRKLSQGIN